MAKGRRPPPRSRVRGPLRASPKGAKPRHLPAGIRLVHEDDDLIVIDKPPGLLTAGLPGQNVESVFAHLKTYVKDQYKRRGTKVWIIHRLDKEASGLLVFAKSERAYEFLKEEFRAKRPHRLYAAVVEGEIAGAAAPQEGRKLAQPASGTIQSYLMEDAKGIVHSFDAPTQATQAMKSPNFRASNSEERGDHPKLAVTHWRLMESALGRSLLQVRLETGRKNQIRVHMKTIGHPIVGDRRYGAATDPIGRVCLHAMELGFAHPANGQVMRFRSPIPGPFLSLVGKQKSDALETEQEPAAPPPPTPPAPAKTSVPAAPPAGWDHVAEWYSGLIEERTSDHHELVILPGVMRLLGAEAGARVLDVACGQGILAHRLGAAGVTTVGIDASPRLIDAAKAGAGPNESYVVGDARTIAELDLGQPFDAAACVMALMNMDPLAPVLAGIAGKLRQGGRFVAVILHPAFRSPGQTSWGWDTPKNSRGGARQYRRVDGYLSPGVTPITMNPGAVARGSPPVTTLTYHRPVQAYIKAVVEAGLLVDALEEWPSMRTSQPGPRAAEENRARREIPMFLALRAIKA
jgi:Pseudouridylate synthases, 23S RNA-specific